MKPQSPYKAFRFTSAAFDEQTGETVLSYAFDEELTFYERYRFTAGKINPALLHALHLAAGVSYYKAFCPPEIIVETQALSEEDRNFWTMFYTQGLGEFFYRNEIDFNNLIRIRSSDAAHAVKEQHAVPLRQEPREACDPLVPIGGGKDSFVTIELLRKAGIEPTLFIMGNNARVQEAADATELTVLRAERELDPKFLQMIKEGKVLYNGHVPITGILSIAALITADLNGKTDVVMSNERSANFGNVMVGGVEINHQFSKSLTYEKAFAEYLERSGVSAPRYFSLLRGWSELRIVQEFVALKKYRDVMTSCNANFSITKKAGKRWCGECPKCAFVFAMLGAFMLENDLIAMFDKNLFADETLVPMYTGLFGEGVKPFECVGEPDEVKAAFVLMHRAEKFTDTPVMQFFVNKILPSINDQDELVAGALEPSVEHRIPDEYQNVL